jgi:hypothetical protein
MVNDLLLRRNQPLDIFADKATFSKNLQISLQTAGVDNKTDGKKKK